MVAAPKNASLTFRGEDGKLSVVDCYISDVVGASGRFSKTANAGTSSDTILRFDNTQTLVDFSVITGLTDTTSVTFYANGTPIPSVIRYANVLNTLPFRVPLNIKFPAGSLISLTQQ